MKWSLKLILSRKMSCNIIFMAFSYLLVDGFNYSSFQWFYKSVYDWFFFLTCFHFQKEKKKPSFNCYGTSPVDIYSGPNNHLVECKLQPLICPKENRLQILEGMLTTAGNEDWTSRIASGSPVSVPRKVRKPRSRPAERAKK